MIRDSGILTLDKFFNPDNMNDIVLNPYFGNPESNSDRDYTEISFVNFLENPDDYTEKIKDKYILIGESGELLHDQVVSPRSGKMIP